MSSSTHSGRRGEPFVSAEASLSRDPDAPAAARQVLARHLETVPRPVVDDALILVSELVTNAVRYGREPVELRLVVTAEVVRVEVRDDGDELPEPAASLPGADETSGRGLLIVDAIATRWGVVQHSDSPGKTVWFELAGARASHAT